MEVKNPKKAPEHAEGIARKYNDELHLIHVVDIGVDTSIKAVEELMESLEENDQLYEHINDKLNSLTEEVSDNIVTKEVIKSGKPALEIRKYTENNDIDLVVMATQGRSGIDRFLLGSVTEKVIRSVDVPVLAVNSN